MAYSFSLASPALKSYQDPGIWSVVFAGNLPTSEVNSEIIFPEDVQDGDILITPSEFWKPSSFFTFQNPRDKNKEKPTGSTVLVDSTTDPGGSSPYVVGNISYKFLSSSDAGNPVYTNTYGGVYTGGLFNTKSYILRNTKPSLNFSVETLNTSSTDSTYEHNITNLSNIKGPKVVLTLNASFCNLSSSYRPSVNPCVTSFTPTTDLYPFNSTTAGYVSFGGFVPNGYPITQYSLIIDNASIATAFKSRVDANIGTTKRRATVVIKHVT